MTALPGPVREDCQCGCGTFGVRSAKKMRDGLQHVKGCPCARCRGSRVKRSSSARERRAAKRIGGERAVLSGAVSGYDIRVPLANGDWLYIEETVDHKIWAGAHRWWQTKTVRLKIARLLGLRGVRALVGPELVVMPRRDFDHLVQCARHQQ